MVQKMESVQVVLIVAAPGDLQAGLQVLVAKLPGVEVLAVADGRAALSVLARYRPALVIVDGDLLEVRSQTLMRQIKERWPPVRYLVLLNDPKGREEALANGADAALVKGYPAARLVTVVEQLLDVEEAGNEKTLACEKEGQS
jgi:DNA-binding NarL/FixJ family response regulator